MIPINRTVMTLYTIVFFYIFKGTWFLYNTETRSQRLGTNIWIFFSRSAPATKNLASCPIHYSLLLIRILPPAHQQPVIPIH